MSSRLTTNLPWANPSCLAFFKEHRASIQEAYPSELHFLQRVAPQVQSVLDVGCAAGGFYPIFKEYNPAIQYEGVDVVPEMIAQAKQKYPGPNFQLVRGDALPFADDNKDLVFCTGLFHLIHHYAAYLQELYRVARRWLLVDFRVHMEPSLCSEMWVAFGNVTKQEEWKVPYYVLNFSTYLKMLCSLAPTPEKIEIYGYPGQVSPNTREDIKNVLFLFSNIRKGTGKNGFPEISLRIARHP